MILNFGASIIAADAPHSFFQTRWFGRTQEHPVHSAHLSLMFINVYFQCWWDLSHPKVCMTCSLVCARCLFFLRFLLFWFFFVWMHSPMHLTGKKHTKLLVRFSHFPTLSLSLSPHTLLLLLSSSSSSSALLSCLCSLSTIEWFLLTFFLSVFSFKSPFYSDL